ncbi:MAG: hypothetical protein LJE92_06830 [Gammaproteobacteria bacterium]|nr:hypothetical protein [Gammaproteobacteria bacterium]
MDNIELDWDELDRLDTADYSMATEIFEQHEYRFGESQARPHRQKPLDELVREHIEGNRKSRSKLQAMFNKFVYRK